MPFTTEQFFAVFAAYNEAIWPAQIVLHLAGLLAVGLLLRPSRASALGIAAILGFIWTVNGAGYHWSYFAEINPVARLFGIVFVAEALLLVVLPVSFPDLRFELRADARSALGVALMAYAMGIYPVLGLAAGHGWPALPVFGVAPCPSTIFTIGLLLLAPWKAVRWALAVPVLWSGIGGTAAVLLGVPQDAGLVAAGAVVVLVALGRWRRAGFARHGEPA